MGPLAIRGVPVFEVSHRVHARTRAASDKVCGGASPIANRGFLGAKAKGRRQKAEGKKRVRGKRVRGKRVRGKRVRGKRVRGKRVRGDHD
jgi:hypothetical protein